MPAVINAREIIAPIVINKIPRGNLKKRTLMYAKTAASVIKIEKKIKMCIVLCTIRIINSYHSKVAI